jgi:succinate dehydrogenase/fumarate reductase cytochrome b subunit
VDAILAVSIKTKTWATLPLVVLALVEFATAMYVFGRKDKKPHARLMLRLHRILGYVFLVYWLWPMWVGLNLLGRLSRQSAAFPEGLKWTFDGPRFYHAFLGVVVFVLLLLKVSFVRLFKEYRDQARPLGIAVSVLTVVIWVIAGLFWLAMMGTPVLEE